jgi:hypothetical protein
MNVEQQIQVRGFRAHLKVSGVEVLADNVATFKVLVEDLPPMAEPYQLARGRNPVYVKITALEDDVDDARTVQIMVDRGYGRSFKVLKLTDDYDPIYATWICEAQRLPVQ